MVNLVKITELVRFDWFIKYMFRDKALSDCRNQIEILIRLVYQIYVPR